MSSSTTCLQSITMVMLEMPKQAIHFIARTRLQLSLSFHVFHILFSLLQHLSSGIMHAKINSNTTNVIKICSIKVSLFHTVINRIELPSTRPTAVVPKTLPDLMYHTLSFLELRFRFFQMLLHTMTKK